MSDSSNNSKRGTVLAGFDKLVNGYKRLLRAAYDALGPGKTQQERNQVRQALGEALGDQQGQQAPAAPTPTGAGAPKPDDRG